MYTPFKVLLSLLLRYLIEWDTRYLKSKLYKFNILKKNKKYNVFIEPLSGLKEVLTM